MRWRRVRKWAKWGFTGAAGVLVVAALLSRFWVFAAIAIPRDRSGFWGIGAGEGLVRVTRGSNQAPEFATWNTDWHIASARKWYWGFQNEMARFGYVEGWRGGFGYGSSNGVVRVGFSLVYPLLLVSIPATALWFADRPPREPGRCAKCGNYRAAVAAGVKCPECGTAPTT
jgi:hypothetical protein